MSGVINTIAGTGVAGYTGDGGLASAATLNRPHAMVRHETIIYIADTSNHVVRRVNNASQIATVAGKGTLGYNGDNRPARSTYLSGPRGIVIRNSQPTFSDTGNHSIRAIDSAGLIRRVAGTGVAGHSGDGGPAVAATLNAPWGLATDSVGGLYVADTFNSVIRYIDADGIITTVAGTGSPGYSGNGDLATQAQLKFPTAVACNATNLYIADSFNHVIRKVALSTRRIVRFAGNHAKTPVGYNGGPANSVALPYVSGLTLLPDGALLASLPGIDRTAIVASGVVTSGAGYGLPGYSGDGGAAREARLQGCVGLSATSDSYLIADVMNHCIRTVSLT